jgi:hypothetical protein
MVDMKTLIDEVCIESLFLIRTKPYRLVICIYSWLRAKKSLTAGRRRRLMIPTCRSERARVVSRRCEAGLIYL